MAIDKVHSSQLQNTEKKNIKQSSSLALRQSKLDQEHTHTLKSIFLMSLLITLLAFE
jgi:hypothetical protein